jgi:hypothetical protein
MMISSEQRGGFNIYATLEDLPPAFRRYVIFNEGIGTHFFKHPLYVDFMPLALPLPIKEFFELKTKWVNSALTENKSPLTYLGRHERAYRSSILIDLLKDGYWDTAHTDPKKACEFWKCASYVWTDCEDDEGASIWQEILGAEVPHREFMTSSADRKALRAMGDSITIYRGVQGMDRDMAFLEGVQGYQWTLNRDTAKFFSKRFLRAPDRPYIMKTTVRTSDVIAYLTSRGESEIVFPPDKLNWSEVAIGGAV